MQKWKAKLVAAIKRERRFPGLQQRPGFGLMSFEVIWSRGRKNGFLGAITTFLIRALFNLPLRLVIYEGTIQQNRV